jgi:methylglutaconyl-CoA hydratase
MNGSKMKFIKINEIDGVAEVILNRPDLRNAFNPEMILEIRKCFQTLSRRKDLRVVVLKGEGKSFCAGADLNWMRESVNYNLSKNKKDAEILFDMFQAVASCPHPVVGLVQGAAFGGALGLIAACDIVISEEKTTFGFSEVKLGIAPAVISHFVLQKSPLGLVGPLMISGRSFDASEAKGIGLIHYIVAESEMPVTLCQVLDSFGEAGPEAVRETKMLLAKVNNATVSRAKAMSTLVIAKRRVSTEGQEGLKGFLEKKVPSWKSLWKVRS